MSIKKDEKGVSPVIGVILMVAITVILAAVIASFVFGMAGTVKRTYTVAATAEAIDSDNDGDTDTIVITYHGGPDAQYVTKVDYVIDGTKEDNLCDNSDQNKKCVAGKSKVEDMTGKPGQHSVVVSATFQDGTQQVILKATVTTTE